MNALPPALAALGRWPQFVCWYAMPSRTTPGKFDKFPCAWASGLGVDKTGRPVVAGGICDAQNPAFWTTFENAAAVAPLFDKGHGCGVGFVLTEQDPFFCLDIDGAMQPDGQWSPLAKDLCRTFYGAGVEVSQSGKGLHIFGCATPIPHAKKNVPLGLELYTEKRFIALTGLGTTGDCWTDHSERFATVVASLFDPAKNHEFEGWTEEPCEGWQGPEDDDALLARAMRHSPKPKDGRAVVTFAQLFTADAAALGAEWPSDKGPFDASSADIQLANLLAYFTGKNCAQMERLMRRSALAREKWDEREDYLPNTITNSCAFIGKVLNEPQHDFGPAPVRPTHDQTVTMAAAPAAATAGTGGTLITDATATLRTTSEYMLAQQQEEHFRGCVYIDETETIYVTHRGKEYKRGAFDANFGGYFFVTDQMGKKTTESAYEALTKSKVFKHTTVDAMAFRPTEPPGAIIDDGHSRVVNSYVPYTPRTVEGDPAPFLDLLSRLLPDEQDRTILLHYLACVIQNPGRKLQWWPVLQGAEGNGKSFILSLVTYALGSHHCHLPNVAALARTGMQFNDWIHRKLFIGMEEVYVPERRGFLEEFKTVVTNKRIGMEAKGGKQSTRDNVANGCLLTNYMDGVPVNVDNRRYAVFYTAQQNAEDVARDMPPEFFSHLWNWAEADGYAIVTHYLMNYELQYEFSPLGAFSARAPQTSSSARAVKESRGRIEQEIMEAIDGGRPGFAGGWVSSRMLDDLLERARANLPRNKRDGVMEALGYVKHPAFGPDGRAHRAVKPDGYKSVLWAKLGSLAMNFTDPEAAASSYERSQVSTAADMAFGQPPQKETKK